MGPNNNRYATPTNSPNCDTARFRVTIGAAGANSGAILGYGATAWAENANGIYDITLEQPRGGLRFFAASAIMSNTSANGYVFCANDLTAGSSTLRVYIKSAATGALTRPTTGDVILLEATFNESGW